jgi:hypothetical protein
MAVRIVEYHALVTKLSGSMALHYNRASPAEVLAWAKQLHTLAHQMRRAAVAVGADPGAKAAAVDEQQQ